MQNNFVSQTQGKNTVQVELAYKQDTMYRNADLDPQSVIARNAHAGEIVISTFDLPPGIPRNNFVISNNIQYMANCSRISPKQAEFHNFFIPNVNPRNNNIIFYSSVSASTHSVIVPEGYYDDATVLSVAIKDAMNTVTGSSGLTFSVSAEIATAPRSYTLTAAGGTYHFVLTCNAITHGETVWALDTNQANLAVHTIGPMSLQYTWWIDIVSTVLTKYAKMRSITSGAQGNVFIRMVPTDQFREIPWGDVYDSFIKEDITYAFKPSEVVTSVDIQLYDMYGDLLYIPDSLNDKLIFCLYFKAIQ